MQFQENAWRDRRMDGRKDRPYFIGPFWLMLGIQKVISMNYGSSSWKTWRWVRLDLIFSMMDIYINSNLNPFTKFTTSGRSTELKYILPWNISQMIMKTIPISRRIVISYVIKLGIPLWIWWKVNGNWDIMIRIYQWRGSHCRTNTSVRRKRRNPKEQDYENQSLGFE